MPLPASINDLSTAIASNWPTGSEAIAITDDTLRAHAAFIAQVRDIVSNGATHGPLNVNAGPATWGGFISSAVNQSYATYYKGGTLSIPGNEVGLIGTDGGAILGAGVGNNFVIRAQSELVLSSGATESVRIDSLQNTIIKAQSSAPSLTTNGQFVFSLSGSTLTISVRVAGVTKTASLALT